MRVFAQPRIWQRKRQSIEQILNKTSATDNTDIFADITKQKKKKKVFLEMISKPQNFQSFIPLRHPILFSNDKIFFQNE